LESITRKKGPATVKIGIDCPECLLHRGFLEIRKATVDDEKRIRTAIAIVKTVSDNLSPHAVPGVIGTLRETIIRQETGNSDPYAEDKRLSNTSALNLLPRLTRKIKEAHDDLQRLSVATRLSAIGNLIEFDILGYNVHLEKLEAQIDDVKFGIDDSNDFFRVAKSSKTAVLLTDNAGEIAFDRLVVNELKRIGLSVTVAVKSSPIMNDATLEDAIQVGMDRVADKVITTGEASVGLQLSGTSQDFRLAFSQSDLVIAKGMGHYETMTEREWDQPILHLLIAKCRPVALSLGVERGQGAIFLRPTH
jgi:uncharacterized protein with ATP-grasp and redox domains